MPKPPEGRSVGKGEQTRSTILDAAIVRFGRDGYRSTSVADIARDAGVSGTATYAIEVVRAQAKLEPPLRTLQGATSGTLGGALVVTMFADITVHGRTISGIPVSSTGSLQIDFADYGS